MEKFLEKIQKDLDEKILNCVNGGDIIKPFDTVYSKVREKPVKRKISKISDDEKSIYEKVIKQFLLENPDLLIKK